MRHTIRGRSGSKELAPLLSNFQIASAGDSTSNAGPQKRVVFSSFRDVLDLDTSAFYDRKR